VNLQQSNLLTLDWLFHPDNFTGGAVWPIDQSATTGTGAAGTITAGVCTPFGAETDVVYTWTVRDATNLVSNGLAITVPNPGGGVAQGLSVSRAAGIQSAKVAPKPRPKSP
jgi:hypothetical protein